MKWNFFSECVSLESVNQTEDDMQSQTPATGNTLPLNPLIHEHIEGVNSRTGTNNTINLIRYEAEMLFLSSAEAPT